MHRQLSGLRGTCLALAATAGLLATPWALAQQIRPVAVNTTPAAPEGQYEELDEVVVQGGRLYDRIVRAEDRFFKLYNELNKNDDYDTNCAFLTLDSDSHIEQRVCMPSFYADAKTEQIRLNIYCNSLTERNEDGEILSRGVCYEPPPAELVFFDRRDAYVKNVMDVIRSDPRLQEMAEELDAMHRERDMLARRYDEIRADQVAREEPRKQRVPRVR